MGRLPWVQDLRDRAGEALVEEVLNHRKILREVVMRHARVKPPTFPDLGPGLANDVGQLVGLKHIEVLPSSVALVDAEKNAMVAAIKARVAIHQGEGTK